MYLVKSLVLIVEMRQHKLIGLIVPLLDSSIREKCTGKSSIILGSPLVIIYHCGALQKRVSS